MKSKWLFVLFLAVSGCISDDFEYEYSVIGSLDYEIHKVDRDHYIATITGELVENGPMADSVTLYWTTGHYSDDMMFPETYRFYSPAAMTDGRHFTIKHWFPPGAYFILGFKSATQKSYSQLYFFNGPNGTVGVAEGE